VSGLAVAYARGDARALSVAHAAALTARLAACGQAVEFIVHKSFAAERAPRCPECLAAWAGAR